MAKYNGTSKNGLPVLRNPPQLRQIAAVPYHSLLFTVHSNLRIAEPPYSELRTLKSRPNGQNQYKFPLKTDSVYILEKKVE